MRLALKAWILFFRVSKQDPCFTAIEEEGGDKRLVELDLTCKAGGVAPRYFKLVTSCTFWPFMLISALVLFVLLVTILLFAVMTLIPYALALSVSMSARL